MEKKLLLAASLLAVLALAGCSEPSAEGGETLTEPPALTVEAGDGTVQTLRGTYSWRYAVGGEETDVKADSAHPLDCEDIMPALETEEPRAVRAFAEEPDVVTVCCWSEDCWGIPATDSEDVDLAGNEVALKPGSWIYEVQAAWNSRKDWSGTAYDSFFVATPDGGA